jgi:hypothetical protein
MSIIQSNKSLSGIEQTDPQLAANIISTWKSDPKLRDEFRNDLTHYAAYRRAQAGGRFKVLSGQITTGAKLAR